LSHSSTTNNSKPDSDQRELYATCASGLEHILAAELGELALPGIQVAGAGVRFHGGVKAGYTACLWSRVANRILLPIHSGKAESPEALYALIQEIDWSEHLDVDGSLAVDFFTAKSAITHSQYGALKVKDAVVDQFRESTGRRPNVERETPDVRINVYLFRDKARVAIDLSGSSLHRRGYRDAQGLAPLKENLAAALLYACQWPEAVEAGQSLVDPMCGSGTLLIEAAMMACHQAPGLYRTYFGFEGWRGHDSEVWAELLAAAKESERLAADTRFYSDLGKNLSRYYAGWDCALFTSLTAPHSRMRLPLNRTLQVQNGGIDCLLLTGSIPSTGHRKSKDVSDRVEDRSSSSTVEDQSESTTADQPEDPVNASAKLSGADLYRGRREEDEDEAESAGAEATIDPTDFINRVKKNQRSLKGWLKQSDIKAYRLYDSDLPDYAVAIDIYEGSTRHCVVQEYQAPATVNLAVAEARLEAVMDVLPGLLDIAQPHVHLKVREVKSGTDQYEKQTKIASHTDVVKEFGAELEVNLTDYLDTGLFLDHRPVRRFISKNSQGKRFLNLFAYTATATAAAVIGGAASSVSVDTSNRYCQWARRNLDRNQAAMQTHEVVRQDVIAWLEAATLSVRDETRFDLILLDPPTYSNSSSLEDDWDVQRDHVKTIQQCLQLLAPGGTLIFSNNFRRFKLDAQFTNDKSNGIRVEDKSRWSIDRDFQRNARIHQCWFFSKEAV